ncbi:MAG: hypothetical protein U0U69_14200 [Acidimicrobiia bacterium]
MTDQLVYSREELLSDHDIAEPLVVRGVRCHGGFLADGTYVSPRTAQRSGAIEAWRRHHEATFGTEILPAPIDEWPEAYPNVAQTKYLLSVGVREPTIAALTRIGTVEGFGAFLPYVIVPGLGEHFAGDVEATAIDHLERGLIDAHARDEAGDGSVAGHRDMWFALRDTAFESPPAEDETELMLARLGIGSGSGGGFLTTARLVPEVDENVEFLLARMISLLFIEVQAFHTFAWAEAVLSDRDLVAGDGLAATIVSYIRQDEAPHVGYLRVVLSEMRDRDFRTADGSSTIAGAEVVGRLYEHNKANLHARRDDGYRLMLGEIERAVAPRRDASDVMARFHDLGSVRPGPGGTFAEAVARTEY